MQSQVRKFAVLWTPNLTQKVKIWNDGFLSFHSFNRRAMLYDDSSRRVVGSAFFPLLDIDIGMHVEVDGFLVSIEAFLSEKVICTDDVVVQRSAKARKVLGSPPKAETYSGTWEDRPASLNLKRPQNRISESRPLIDQRECLKNGQTPSKPQVLKKYQDRTDASGHKYRSSQAIVDRSSGQKILNRDASNVKFNENGNCSADVVGKAVVNAQSLERNKQPLEVRREYAEVNGPSLEGNITKGYSSKVKKHPASSERNPNRNVRHISRQNNAEILSENETGTDKGASNGANVSANTTSKTSSSKTLQADRNHSNDARQDSQGSVCANEIDRQLQSLSNSWIFANDSCPKTLQCLNISSNRRLSVQLQTENNYLKTKEHYIVSEEQVQHYTEQKMSYSTEERPKHVTEQLSRKMIEEARPKMQQQQSERQSKRQSEQLSEHQAEKYTEITTSQLVDPCETMLQRMIDKRKSYSNNDRNSTDSIPDVSLQQYDGPAQPPDKPVRPQDKPVQQDNLQNIRRERTIQQRQHRGISMQERNEKRVQVKKEQNQSIWRTDSADVPIKTEPDAALPERAQEFAGRRAAQRRSRERTQQPSSAHVKQEHSASKQLGGFVSAASFMMHID